MTVKTLELPLHLLYPFYVERSRKEFFTDCLLPAFSHMNDYRWALFLKLTLAWDAYERALKQAGERDAEEAWVRNTGRVLQPYLRK